MLADIGVDERPLSRGAGEGGARGLDPGPPGEGWSGRVAFARKLRLNATDTERRLWAALRSRRLLGYKFRRQLPIGPFILDFACTRHLLAIEVDGSQHGSGYDARRTAWLERHGWRVLRFWDSEVLTNPEGVVQVILHELRERDPLALPRLRRGRGQEGRW